MPGVMIRTFLADGVVDGLRTLEISNSTVLGTVFPRPALDSCLKRAAAQRPGVYVLVGPDTEGAGETRVYVGEGDPAGPRLRAHGVQKDFWTHALVFTSKDDYLTKTQIQFLESRLIAEIRSAGRAVLDNGNTPTEPRISEADQAEVEGFLDQLRLLVGAAGFDFLRSRAAPRQSRNEGASTFTYRVRTAEARLVRTQSAYTVLQGSTALADARPSAQSWVSRLRSELTKAGILVPRDGELLTFTKDAEFESASAAAVVIAGGNVNGRVMFKRADGKTLREVEEEEAAKATGVPA